MRIEDIDVAKHLLSTAIAALGIWESITLISLQNISLMHLPLKGFPEIKYKRRYRP
jgi:hypothetical protein